MLENLHDVSHANQIFLMIGKIEFFLALSLHQLRFSKGFYSVGEDSHGLSFSII